MEHMDLMSSLSSSRRYIHLLTLVLVVTALDASFLEVVVAVVNSPSLFPLIQEVEADSQCDHFGCNVVVVVVVLQHY